MAKRANVFTADLMMLFEHLLRLQLTSYLNQSTIADSIKSRSKILAERTAQGKRDKPTFYIGSALLVPDYESTAPWVKRHSYKSRNATDEDLLALMEEVGNRLNGEVICSAFEAMEKYFKSVGSKAYFHVRGDEGSN